MTEHYGYGQEPTPPAIGQEPTAPATGQHTQQAENVRPIDSGPVDYDLDARRVTTKPDYRLRFKGRTWTVTQPDVGTVMAAEQAPTTEAFMSLMFEDQWPELERDFKAYQDPGVIFEVATNIARHFDLDAAAAGGRQNRAQRRANPRRG